MTKDSGRAPSARALRVWSRLTDWYGTRLTEQYGDKPPTEWCSAVDRVDNESVRRGLLNVRSEYLQHPPTLPQFLKALKPGAGQRSHASTVDEQLEVFVARKAHALMSSDQPARFWWFSQPWIYRYRTTDTPDGKQGAECVAIEIPPAHGYPMLRVTLEDLRTEGCAAT